MSPPKAEKPVMRREFREVIYSERRWQILRSKRRKALRVLEALSNVGLRALVHGSIARGDVKPYSDIDVFIPFSVGEGLLIGVLETSGFSIYSREIVQATPHHVPKLIVSLDEETTIAIPLSDLHKTEREFYKFGGELDIEGLRRGLRVPGVNKRLMLIEPTPRGHRESSVVGREGEVAHVLGIDVETVLERVRVLTRRDRVGRTGLYIRYVLPPDEPVEQALRKLAAMKPGLKKRLNLL